MKIDFFFKGTLRKEEVASAFLATALEQSLAFRRMFFGLLDPGRAETLAGQSWKTTVEAPSESRRVDVTLESEGVFVIIENKVAAGAKQEGQLQSYYSVARQQHPRARIIAVYLAPGAVGKNDEVPQVIDQIARAGQDRAERGDSAHHVSWEMLGEAVEAQADVEPEVRDGIKRVVQEVVDIRARRVIDYDGDAGILREIANACETRLRPPREPALKRFSSQAQEELNWFGRVTVWMHVAPQRDEHYERLATTDERGDLRITLRLQFKPRRDARDPKLREWFEHASRQPPEISGWTPDFRDGWVVLERSVDGESKTSCADQLVSAGQILLDWLGVELGEELSAQRT